jgi:hypothetical protein
MPPRRTLLAAVAGFALAGIFLVSSIAAQDQGLALFHKMQQALGGEGKIAAIRDLDWTVQARTFTHEGKPIGQVTKRTRWIRPNYLRLDQIGPRDTYVLYFDGTSGWEILPDKREALTGGELEFAKGYLSGFIVTQWLADLSSDSMITSPAPDVVRLTLNGQATDFTLDPASWLPVKSVSGSLADPSHPSTAESDYLAWIKVMGVNFPARMRHSNSGDGWADMNTKQLLLNSALDRKVLAAKPPASKPDVAP